MQIKSWTATKNFMDLKSQSENQMFIPFMSIKKTISIYSCATQNLFKTWKTNWNYAITDQIEKPGSHYAI